MVEQSQLVGTEKLMLNYDRASSTATNDIGKLVVDLIILQVHQAEMASSFSSEKKALRFSKKNNLPFEPCSVCTDFLSPGLTVRKPVDAPCLYYLDVVQKYS